MTPLVDVAFLLLTFFMLTATFRVTEGVSVQLPAAHARQKIDRERLILITLDENGTVFLRSFLEGPDETYDTYRPVTEEVLKSYLSSRKGKEALQAVIQADKDLRYEVIEPVFDIVRASGLTAVRLATEPYE